MNFDGSISLGDIMTIFLFIVGGLGAYMRIRLDMHEIRVKTDTMWNAFMSARRLVIERVPGDKEAEGS